MGTLFGIGAALIAFLAWGFGDFFIQRSTRKVGTLISLFVIGLIGFVFLLPFVWNEIPNIFSSRSVLSLIAITVGITLLTALAELEALRRGKIAVIEPILSFELVFTAAIGIALLQEKVTLWQSLIILIIFVGIILAVIRKPEKHWWQFWKKHSWLEQGVLLAVLGALLMGVTNVLSGLLSRNTSPIAAIWFIHGSLALIVFGWFIIRQRVAKTYQLILENKRTVLTQGFLDNIAWLAYAYAVLSIPISITIAITESYVALSSILGVVINHERLQRHQYVGAILSITAAVILAIVSGQA